jgi:hypothetical protein
MFQLTISSTRLWIMNSMLHIVKKIHFLLWDLAIFLFTSYQTVQRFRMEWPRFHGTRIFSCCAELNFLLGA